MPDPLALAAWGTARLPFICAYCEWRYLIARDSVPDSCPHCAASSIQVLDLEDSRFPSLMEPELIVPFSVSAATVAARIAEFSKGIPLPPTDLSQGLGDGRLMQRLARLYLPVWLVDTDAQSPWQAEVGYDYEVVSHRERYTDGEGWRTAEVRENRIRWEPRVGCLSRHYDNIPAPALDTHAALARVLGGYDTRVAEAVADQMTDDIVIRAPDRDPDAAWTDARAGFRLRAQDECREAAGAAHVRDFRWSPSFSHTEWTLLLLPLYATFYRDDDGAARQVLVNGQTGVLYGVRRGSLVRAQRRALTIGIAALVVFIISLVVGLLGLLFPPLVVANVSIGGTVGGVAAALVGAGASIPITRVALYNRHQSRQPVEV